MVNCVNETIFSYFNGESCWSYRNTSLSFRPLFYDDITSENMLSLLFQNNSALMNDANAVSFFRK